MSERCEREGGGSQEDILEAHDGVGRGVVEELSGGDNHHHGVGGGSQEGLLGAGGEADEISERHRGEGGGGSQEGLLGAHGGADQRGGGGEHRINLKTENKRRLSGTFISNTSTNIKNRVKGLVDKYEGWEKESGMSERVTPRKLFQFGQDPGDTLASPFKRRRLMGLGSVAPPCPQARSLTSSPGTRPSPRRCRGTRGRWPATLSTGCHVPPAFAATISPQQRVFKRDKEWTASRWPPSYGTRLGSAPAPSSSSRRPGEYMPTQRDNWLDKPGMVHPPSTVLNIWNLHLHHEHLHPSRGEGDLPDGSAAPRSSPLLGEPGKGREDKNIIYGRENEATLSSHSELPRGTLSGRIATLSGRLDKEDRSHHHHQNQEDWKIKKKKEESTYLLVPEPETSPGTSVPASSKPTVLTASSSSSSGTEAATTCPGGRGKGAGGTGSQGSKLNIDIDTHSDLNFNGALHAQTCLTTAAYIGTDISALNLNLMGGKTTALGDCDQTDQWEGRMISNRNTATVLASNIVPQAVATPRGVAMSPN